MDKAVQLPTLRSSPPPYYSSPFDSPPLSADLSPSLYSRLTERGVFQFSTEQIPPFRLSPFFIVG